MAEILVGSNSPIRLRIFWQGQPTDADNLPVVFVYDVTEDPTITPAINPEVKIAQITAVYLDTEIGVYECFLPTSITDRNRSLRIVWNYSVNGQAQTKTHKVFVVTPYADLAQAADTLGIGAEPSDPNYKTWAELAEAERYARKKIENYTGQQFFLYDDVFTVYGSGSDSLQLPQKIYELHELYVNDILLKDELKNIDNWNYPVEISPSGLAIRVNRAGLLDNTVYTANGMVPPTISDTWNGAFENNTPYRVQGRFGWKDVPDDVELACIELMKDYFSQDKNWKHKYIKNIQTFDWQFEYDSNVFSGTGNSYADQLLSNYVLSQIIII